MIKLAKQLGLLILLSDNGSIKHIVTTNGFSKFMGILWGFGYGII